MSVDRLGEEIAAAIQRANRRGMTGQETTAVLIECAALFWMNRPGGGSDDDVRAFVTLAAKKAAREAKGRRPWLSR